MDKEQKWYDYAVELVVDQTWITRLTIFELCSKRFYEFHLRKFVEDWVD